MFRDRFLIFGIVVSFLYIVQCTPDRNSQEFRVVALFATPIDEPWNQVIHQAVISLKDTCNYDYKFIDKLNDPAKFERELRKHANQGVNVILGDAYKAEMEVRRVARDFADSNVYFCFGSGLGASTNLSVFDNWIHEPAYLAGIIAGQLTTSDTIGIIAGYKFAEVNRLVNAFMLGARELNKKTVFIVKYIEDWYNRKKARDIAESVIEMGADIIYAERDGVIAACERASIPVIGNITDQSYIAPKIVITSVLWDLGPTIKHFINSIKNKTYQAENYAQWSMMSKSNTRLAKIHDSWKDKIGKRALDLIEKRTDQILYGKFRVPILESAPSQLQYGDTLKLIYDKW